MVAITHKGQRAVAEILEDRPQGLEPLDTEDHVEGAECKVIAREDEGLTGDVDGEVGAAPRAHDTVSIGHCHLKPAAAMEGDPSSRSHRRVDEIVHRS
jgi:hypothetical protein